MLAVAAWWAARLRRTRQLSSYLGHVTIRMDGKTLTIPALLDSGNTLRHPVNNWPVVVVQRDVAARLFAGNLLSWLDDPLSLPPPDWETQIGLIPYKSVGGQGFLAAVRPDQVIISCQRGSRVLTQVYVAVGSSGDRPHEYQAGSSPITDQRQGYSCNGKGPQDHPQVDTDLDSNYCG